jgi:IS605 OrfB family transposase
VLNALDVFILQMQEFLQRLGISLMVNAMLLTKKSRITNLTNQEFHLLQHLAHLSKDVYNSALYQIRQHFFETDQYLPMPEVWKIIKETENYKLLGSDPSQQTLNTLDRSFRSFFSLLKLKRAGKYTEKVRIPNYLEKDACFILTFPIRKGRSETQFSFRPHKSLQDQFGVKKIAVQRPDYLLGKTIKEVKIIFRGLFFEICWTYEEPEQKHDLNPDRVLAIDPGVSNFATIVSNNPESRPIILDGREMKSINQWANKRSTTKQPGSKNKQRLWNKRDRQLNEFLNQYVNLILNLCLEEKAKTVVMGCGYLANNRMSDQNNQNFKFLPFGQFCSKLKGKLELHGIDVKFQDEAYTSKCDHLAGETMESHDEYAGKRVCRGLFQSSTGVKLNADVNGALGILIKSGICDAASMMLPASRGCLTQPRRVRLDDIRQNSSRRLAFELTKPQGLPCGQ